MCIQCKKPKCLDACPQGAMTRTKDLGTIVIDESLCNECKACVDACQIGAISFEREDESPLICDLCGGDPSCVKWCPFGALEFSVRGPVLKQPARKRTGISVLKAEKFARKQKLPEELIDWYRKFT